jgi:putative transposase
MKWIERDKLYPPRAQHARLQMQLDVCRDLYNAALQQRRDAWRTRHLNITHTRQYAELTQLRAADTRFAGVYRELLDAALHKLDLAFRAFYRRCATGETPGFPRFRAARRYNTLEFPHGNRALRWNVTRSKIKLPGIGTVRLRKGRMVAAFGRAMIVRSPRGWHALFECERATAPLPATGRIADVDVGIATFYASSDGHKEPNLRLGRCKAAAIARLQRIVAKRRRGSQRRHQAVGLLARAQESLRWVRRDWHHKLARKLVDSYDTIVFERLAVRRMSRSAKGSVNAPGTHVRQKAGLNRAMLDAGWSQFTSIVAAKAEEAGRQVVFVEARFMSQTCSRCGYVAAESRPTQAAFACVCCGCADDADVNAAKNILKRAKLSPAGRGVASADPLDPRSVLPSGRTRLAQHDAA